MSGFDEFLKVFGNVTVLQLVEIILAIIFIIVVFKKFKDYINKQHDVEKKRDEELKEALDGVRMYPKYREQSIEIQKELEGKFDTVCEMYKTLVDRLDEIERKRNETERKKLQETLLQHYRMFTDPKKNEMQAWTEMEANAFWELFSEYEDKGGDGFMHTIVQPAMNQLAVVKMDDEQKLYELMHSRKL